MVHAHEEAHGCIEDDPHDEEEAGAAHRDTAEEEGHGWEEETWFLVWEEGEEHRCGERGERAHIAHPVWHQRPAEERD